jgi:hypothetical protein
MEKVIRHALASHIDALGIELKIARVTIPGLRDGVNVAKMAAFKGSVQRIVGLSQELAKTAGINDVAESHAPDFDEVVDATEEEEEEDV